MSEWVKHFKSLPQETRTTRIVAGDAVTGALSLVESVWDTATRGLYASVIFAGIAQDTGDDIEILWAISPVSSLEDGKAWCDAQRVHIKARL